jgi:protocatechuate 3,4-dioxygenase beta subunit
VAPGSYTVSVTKLAGDTFSTTGTAAVTTSSGSAVTAAPIGEYAPGTVTGTVFTDLTGTGTSAGEPGLSGQTVELLSGTTVVATTTTGASGSYSFAGVAPGSYTVQVVKAAGETFSPAGTLPNSTVSSTGAATATVVSGGTAVVNAGEYAPSTVTGTVFNDLNADGTQEAGDPGLSGQTVSLLSGTTVVATTTTGAGGSYSFAGVAPGSYTVSVTKLAGDTFSPVGTSNTLPDSAVSAAGTASVTAISGSTTIVNAGEYAPPVGTGTISSMVFFDGLADGTYHVGDPGVEGVTVKLLSGTTVVATTTTTSTGAYSFTGVTPGNYTIQVVAPAGMSYSATEHASGNPLLDSDVNPTTGITDTVTVAANAPASSSTATSPAPRRRRSAPARPIPAIAARG